MAKIENLRQYREAGAVKLVNTISGQDAGTSEQWGGWAWEMFGQSYHTDGAGCGLWRGNKQDIGTCQFSLPRDRRAAYGKIYREWFSGKPAEV